jgi:hypothetical protein
MPRDRAAALLPPAFFACAVAFFTTALLLLPWIAGELGRHFYQPAVLAVTHMLTLGWVSMTILGVLYRYVPGLTKARLPYPRLAVAQWAVFVGGTLGLVVHMYIGQWPGTAGVAAVVLLAAVLLCANLWPLLWREPERGVATVGLLLATAFFVVAAALGTLLAVDKTWPVLGGGALTNLGAHVHLAAAGWVGATIAALSFRFLPAFLLPAVDLTRPARVQVVVLAAAVVALAAALLARSAFVAPAAVAVAGALVAHVVLVARLVASRRMPVDWTARHAVAGVVWLAATIGAGLGVLALGAYTAAGARLAAAYGAAGILGWMSNLIIGVSYRLFPGFVVAARTAGRRAPLPLAVLGVPGWTAPPTFCAYNGGLVLLVGGLAVGSPGALFAGSVVLALAGLVYGLATARTLAFVVRDPRARLPPLAVLP